jgi:biopolymer transport protein ExbD
VKIRRRARHHNVIPTASMADIAMLLLIFFMSTTIIRSREALEVRLPGATTGDPIRKETAIRVSLGPSGEVALNDARVEMGEVAPILAGKLRGNPNLRILLHADARSPYAIVAALIEQLEAARAPRVALVANRKGAP